MKRIIVIIGLMLATFSIASGQSNQKSKDNIEETLKQMTTDWENAYKNFDADALERILADDWVAVGDEGNKHTKAESIANVKSHRYVIKSYKLDSTVRVYGNTAVVVTDGTEVSTYDGKDSSGQYVTTDVYVKQKDGNWKAVASQVTKKPAAHKP